MLPCSCQQDLDTNFGEEELERIKNRPKLTINTFLNKLSSITHADESYFIVAEDVSNDSPPHRTLWNKITNKITKEREGKGEDGKKVSLFRVGLDNSFISSVVESIVVNPVSFHFYFCNQSSMVDYHISFLIFPKENRLYFHNLNWILNIFQLRCYYS